MRVDFHPHIPFDGIDHQILPSHIRVMPTHADINLTPVKHTRDIDLSSERSHRSLGRANVAHTIQSEIPLRYSKSPVEVFGRPSTNYVHNKHAYSPGISPSKAFSKDVLKVVSPLLDDIRQNINASGAQPSSNFEAADRKVVHGSKEPQESNKKIEQMMKAFNQIQTKVDSLEAQNEANLDQINFFKSKIDNDAKVQSQVDAPQASSGEIKIANNRINKVESDFKNLNGQNQTLLATQEEFDRRLDSEINQVKQQNSEQIKDLQNSMNSQQEALTKEFKRLQNAYLDQFKNFEKEIESQEAAHNKKMRDLKTSFTSQISEIEKKVESKQISSTKVTTTNQKNYDPVIENLKSNALFFDYSLLK